MKVSDFMSSTVELGPEQPCIAAFRQMQDAGLGHLPVTDADGAVVGVLARAHAQRAMSRHQSLHAEVGEIMDAAPVTVTETAPLLAAAQRMLEERVEVLPVVDAQGRLRGLLTAGDLHRALVEALCGAGGVSHHAA
jgi:CBS domain-containing protein